ncbi:MAG: hypothetical protein OEY74_01875 [Gammaproteobacteria bacterium]|nr:hypothetical protein [Gammaproteobacteria bacterium]
MNNPATRPNNWATTNKRNTVRLGYWTLAWVATMAVATFGPRYSWDFATVPTILAFLVNLGMGFGMIVANGRYLQGLDELHKKIFLDAGAFTLGVGLVCGLGYELLENIKLISFETEISHLVVLMCLTFLAGMIFGHRRYQ